MGQAEAIPDEAGDVNITRVIFRLVEPAERSSRFLREQAELKLAKAGVIPADPLVQLG